MSRAALALAAAGVLVLLGLVLAWALDEREPDEGAATDPRVRGRAESSIGAHASVGSHERRHLDASSPTSAEQQVAGRILDVDDGPLAEGVVELRCPDATLHARAPVDEQGWFRGPACGELTCARLVHPISQQREPWRLKPGSVVELEVERAPMLTGQVVHAGEPVAGATIVLRQGERRWTGSSDVDGEFAIGLVRQAVDDPCAGLPALAGEPEPARLLVQAADLRPWLGELGLAEISSAEPSLIELLEPAAPLRGRVLDRAGLAFSRTRVLATSVERPDEVHSGTVAEDGSFELRGLGEGRYGLRAIRDGLELASGTGEAGDEPDLRSDRSARGAALELRLRDAEGRPQARVRVDGGPLRGASSDAEGIVLADEVLAGRYRLRVRVPGCAPQIETIVVDEREVQTIPIELEPTCS